MIRGEVVVFVFICLGVTVSDMRNKLMVADSLHREQLLQTVIAKNLVRPTHNIICSNNY